MNRWVYYLAAIILHLLVLFWMHPPAVSALAATKEKKYLEVSLSSEPGPARPGPDSGPSDQAKAAAAPGPLVNDSPPPVATIAPQPTPPPPAPEPLPEILPPALPPPPVPADPAPVDKAPPPPVEPPLFAEPPPPPVIQPASPAPVTPPLIEVNASPASAAPSAFSSASVSGSGRGNAEKWSPGSGGNGHYYEAVYKPSGFTWTDAQRYALMYGGYLATISSAAENLHVFSLINDPIFWSVTGDGNHHSGPWLGGFKNSTGWHWLNLDGPFKYTRWSFGQPDNRWSNQGRLHFYAISAPDRLPTWDDLSGDERLFGFIVEYDHDPATLPLDLAAASNFTEPVAEPPPRFIPGPFRR